MQKLLLLVLVSICLAAQPLPDPELTEAWTPVPPVVTPGLNHAPPSEAIVLFNGTNLAVVRRFALTLPEVTERPCRDTPGFFVRKPMLRIREGGEPRGGTLALEQGKRLLDRHTDVYSITDPHRNNPAILVHLNAVSERICEEKT